MAKSIRENKDLNPARESMIEGRDAGPGEAEYNFPLDGVTVVATTQLEAERRRDEILKSRGIESKSLTDNK
jgi:hypothetical protein